MGLSISDAIRLLMLRIADEQRLPFAVEVPNAASRCAMEDLSKGKEAVNFLIYGDQLAWLAEGGRVCGAVRGFRPPRLVGEAGVARRTGWRAGQGPSLCSLELGYCVRSWSCGSPGDLA